MTNLITLLLFLLTLLPAEPPPPVISESCQLRIRKVMWVELRGSTDVLGFEFLAEQLVREVLKHKGCSFGGRWTLMARGTPPSITQNALDAVLSRYPYYKWPYCQFIGAESGVRVWERLGWVRPEREYPFKNIHGINCGVH